jgi:signal transduction histidine kinase
MKLLNRAIIYYSMAALLSFTLMGALLYDSIRHNVLRQVSEALLTEKQIIEEQILHTDSLPDFSDIFNHKIEVTLYKNRLKPAQLFIDTLINDPVSGSLVEYRFLVYSNNTPDNRGFVIKTSQSMEEEKGLLYEILTMVIIAFALLLLLLIVIIYSISRNLWGSFYNTLNRIRNFDIKSESEFNPVETHVTEFAQLNQVLRILTGKIRSDYINLKEVTENASHEIQTPLAVIRIKIEQMLQAKNISNQLAENLISINQSVTKISRINQSLGLMSKIENNQYSVTQTVSLNRKIAELLSQFTDFIQSKHLEIKFDNTREVQLEMNTDLVDILLANLLSNAVKHNIDFGWIAIRLNQQELIFQNTGKDPNISTELLFQRFKKAEQSSDSPGLGLAIIKKVADFYNMTVKYTYAENIHTLHISFN